MAVILWLFLILEQNLRHITVGSESIFCQLEKYPHIASCNLNTQLLTGEKSLDSTQNQSYPIDI
ncbi:MAG: hypothetical protein HFI39_13700 [Lachnospiraceae bacterium]|nr:hypothetical protein [Lachnospiraceae bacterium]